MMRPAAAQLIFALSMLLMAWCASARSSATDPSSGTAAGSGAGATTAPAASLANSAAAPAATSATLTPKLTLRQAVERALTSSPDAETAVRTERSSRLLEKNGWYSLLPSLDVEAQHQWSERGGNQLLTVQPEYHAPWSNSLSLTATENLYDNGDTWRQAQIGTLNRQIGGLTLNRTRQAIALKVVKAFYDFSSASISLELEREQIETLRKQFKIIEGRYRQGVSSSRDYLRIKAQLQQAEVGLLNGRVSLEETLASLRESIGDKDHVEFEAVALRPGQLDTLAIPSVRLEDTIDYKIAHLQDQVSDLKYTTVERQYWPRLALKGSYSYNQPQYLDARTAYLDDPYWETRAQLVLDYNLWDWGIRRRNTEIAENTRHIEYASQDSVRINVTQSLQRLSSQAGLLQQSYRENRLILKSNEDVFESVNRDFREGKVTYLDLITSLNDLYNSRTQILNTQFNLLKAQADLNALQGNLDEVILRP